MDEIRRQVIRVRRRLVAAQGIHILSWSLFLALLASAIGIAVPKIWVVGHAGAAWHWSWIGGGLFLGLVSGLAVTWIVRRREWEAAIELDRRFGLRERVSSALFLADEDRGKPIGKALIADAGGRVSRLDVGTQFQVRPTWRPLLPLSAAVAVLLLAFALPDAIPDRQAQASAESAKVTRQVQTSTKNLQKHLEEKKKEAETKGLKDAEALLTKVEKGLQELTQRSDVDRKQAMVRINDLAKALAERQQQLGTPERLKEQFQQLKDLQSGPAGKLAEAMKQGKFDKAQDEIKKLLDKLKDGSLSPEEKKQLAQQLKQMQQRLENMATAHEAAKRELERQIEQKKRDGDLSGAGELQRKLDAMNQQNSQMSRLAQMAQQFDKASKQLQNGDSQQASDQLGQLAKQVSQMQSEMEELETISGALDEIGEAKLSMTCTECNGEGCEACMGAGHKEDGTPGRGMNEGQGMGARPEEETATGSYESRVAAKLRKGEVARAGTAGGENVSGQSAEMIKDEIASSLSEQSDPLENVRLPRRERDHTREYFEHLRGEK